MDCEFIRSKDKEMLGRISLVNYNGQTIFDTVVQPEEQVTDYITHITGLTKESFINAPAFKEVNDHVISLIRDKIVVGHTLKCDFEKLTSNEEMSITYIDVSEHKEFMRDSFKKSKLKDLSSIHLNAKI